MNKSRKMITVAVEKRRQGMELGFMNDEPDCDFAAGQVSGAAVGHGCKRFLYVFFRDGD